MNPETHVENFRRLVADRSGLLLTSEKDYLMKARLEPLARELGLAGLVELLFVVLREPRGAVAGRAVDAMATHESSFFRDATPFDLLRDTLLPAIGATRPSGARLRIWSAACSSGQEPYSLAMLLLENAWRLNNRPVEIVATDMSEPILAKAKAAIYSDFEVRRGLSPERQSRWMERTGSAWRIAPAVRQLVRFQKHNLLDGPLGLGRFDLILCRNVLIYFDAELKKKVLHGLADALEPGGALLLGSSETVVGIESPFAPSPAERGVLRVPAAPTRLRA